MLQTIEKLEKDYKILQNKKLRLMDVIGPKLFKELRERGIKGNSAITKEGRMTKQEAEIYFETSNRKESDDLPWPTKTVPITTLNGVSFLATNFKKNASNQPYKSNKNLRNTEISEIMSYKTKRISEIAKWVGELPNGIKIARNVVMDGQLFLIQKTY